MVPQTPVVREGGPTPSDANAEPSAAEWIVKAAGYPPYKAVGPISKQTAQRVYHPDRWGHGRSEFTEFANVLYRGSEADCRRLAAQLESSRALCEQEQQASSVRHKARQAKLIAALSKGPAQ